MPLKHAGGSIVNGGIFVLVVWGLTLCARQVKARLCDKHARDTPPRGRRSRFTGCLSPDALRELVVSKVCPVRVFDLRGPEQQRARPLSSTWHHVAVQASLEQLAECFASKAKWTATFTNGPGRPTTSCLLVVVTQSKSVFAQAALQARKRGYLYTLQAPELPSPSPFTLPPPHGVPKFINRDALAHLIDFRGMAPMPRDTLLLDLRRTDEVALFGAIQGVKHVPLEAFVCALGKPAAEFEEAAGMPCPSADQMLIVHSRGFKRAKWAAKLAMENGFKNVLVYQQGTSGWKLDPEVYVYPHYELDEKVPEAVPFTLEHVNDISAAAELRRLGIL